MGWAEHSKLLANLISGKLMGLLSFVQTVVHIGFIALVT